MQFSVGDKVVHPQYGPGRIRDIVHQEFVGEAKSYYVIDMPDQGLIVHVPVLTAGKSGIRPAMTRAALHQVLNTLRSGPSRLPDDFRERQAQIDAEFKTGEVLSLATVVRDLTWHKERAHLTRKDSDLLKQGQERLAAEMALVSGEDTAESLKLIGSTMTTALASV
jgi:CarD family transcriptional regulator